MASCSVYFISLFRNVSSTKSTNVLVNENTAQRVLNINFFCTLDSIDPEGSKTSNYYYYYLFAPTVVKIPRAKN